LRGGKGGNFMFGPGRHLASLCHWTRVESFFEKRDSSRVTIFLNVTRVTLSVKQVGSVACWSIIFFTAINGFLDDQL